MCIGSSFGGARSLMGSTVCELGDLRNFWGGDRVVPMTGFTLSPAEFLLYQTEDGRTRVEVRFDGETAWLSLGQMTELFQRDKSVISRHIKNVFDEGELSPEATVAKYATVQHGG